LLKVSNWTRIVKREDLRNAGAQTQENELPFNVAQSHQKGKGKSKKL
jgi:hypothetical protein